MSNPTRGQLRRFELQLESPLTAAEAWARILDLRAHDRLIPFTHIIEGAVPAAELRPGHRFVACTMLRGVGFRGRRLGFNDVMTVEEIIPPMGSRSGNARIVKSGKLILGSVTLTVETAGEATPTMPRVGAATPIVPPGRVGTATGSTGPTGRTGSSGSTGSTIHWVQDFGLARFPAFVGFVASRVAPAAYGLALRRLLRG